MIFNRVWCQEVGGLDAVLEVSFSLYTNGTSDDETR